ncbi:MAG: alpha-galactosidase [Chloroflexi bacterium]|nr:MAG: alpha-galactosidase [Chloroflexota bacterium]
MATSQLTLDALPEPSGSQIINASSLTLSLHQPPKRFFRHGWQSWSLAAWTDLTPLPIQQPRLLHPMQIDPVYANETCPNGSWIAAVEIADNDMLLLGALGLDAHVRLNSDQLQGQYEAGEGEWLVARGDEATVFARYADELGKRLGQKSDRPAPRVWCSWYSLYTAIDEATLHYVFDGLGDLPFDVFQVDDGWQVSIGDWVANTKFPSGMNALAEKIKSTGRTAGLWLAPLIAAESSRLFREHSDWFLRDARGKFVSAGFNWGERLFALDTTHPAALEWLAALMKQVRAWGFDYLKLDFLYAGALPGKRHVDTPREAAYRQGLKIMRAAMGADAFFLTCGAPILPSLGLCDALRVGPDVSGKWEDPRDAILLYNPTTPGTRNAIRTTVNRLWLQPLVMTDPDVAYFVERENSLSLEHKQLLQDLAIVCNFKATSDLPQWMTSAQRESLREFLNSNPNVQRLNHSKFQINERVVDFSSALSLPNPPTGASKIQAALISWLGNQSLALKMLKRLDDLSLKRRKKDLGNKE